MNQTFHDPRGRFFDGLVGDVERGPALAREQARRLRQAVAQLSPLDAEVLLMRTVEGLTNHEAAQVLGAEPGAVSKRFGRAVLKLRQILLDSGMGDPTT